MKHSIKKILIMTVFSILAVSNTTFAHIGEGSGAALQLFSNFTANPPKINGDLTDGTNDPGSTTSGTDKDEWKDAYTRTVTLTDGNPATLFFMNTADSLYVGLSYAHGNNGNPNAVTLYFDQGAGGGNHDDALTGNTAAPNEGAIWTDRSTKTDNYWDGSNWVADVDGLTHFSTAQEYFTNIFHWEFSIPLNNGKSDDLAAGQETELGFLISIFKNGSAGSPFYWDATNSDPTDASGWADIRLGVQRSYTTFYATNNSNGNPTIDGNINSGATADDAWRGAYQQSIVLTNFKGSKLGAVIYAVDNATGNRFYVGMRIDDTDNNAGDYLRIYQEENTTTPADNQDYVLNDEKENGLEADEAAFNGDLYWDSDTPGWISDTEGADGQGGIGVFYTTHYEYEFDIQYNQGAQDLELNAGAKVGFLVHYHDADQPVGERDYFWEFTANSNAVLLDETATPDMYGASGWAAMQLGGPYVQVIYPEDNANAEGVVNVRIYAEDENANGIDSAFFYRKSVPETKFTLTRIAGTDEWAGTWDVSALSNGADTLVVQVGDDDGIVVERLVNLTIANGTGSATPPTVSVSSPTPGTKISGTVTIEFTSAATSPATVSTREISIDGAAYAATTTDTTHSWATSGLTDGTHTVQLKVTDSNGSSTTTQAITYVVDNAPSVSITAPASDSTVTDTITVSFTATPISPATISTTEISVDGGAFVNTATSSSHTLATAALEEGAHTVQIKVTDSNGRIALSEILKFNTSNSPVVSITSPVADSIVNGTLVVAFTATPIASATITTTEISVDGGAFRATSTSSTDTLDTESLTEGSHLIKIRATDSNGKTGLSGILSFNVRNLPSVAITSPAADSTVSDTITVSFTATPVSPATISTTEISIDGGAFVNTTTSSSHTLATGALDDGAHTVQIKVTDSNGKSAQSEVLKINTTNGPAVSITSPVSDSIVNGTLVVAFTATPIASATITTTEISVDGGAFRATSTSSTDTLDTESLTEGSHLIKIRATDSNGKTGLSETLRFNVRNLPSVTITSPAADSTISDTITVSFTATPVSPATISTTEISIDGGAFVNTTTSSSHAWATGAWEDGAHTVQIKVTDSNGKSAQSEILKINTSNSPVVSITSPAADSIVNGTLVVTFTATPIASATITITEISVDGGAFRATSTSSTDTLDTQPLSDAGHSIQIRVTDSNGKRGISRPIKIEVRNSPTVSIDKAIADTVVSGDLVVPFTATPVSPASISSTEIRIDGGSWRTTSSGSTDTLDTGPLTDGNHGIQIRAVDSNGKNNLSQILTFVSDNSAPKISLPKVGYAGGFKTARKGTKIIVSALALDVTAGLDNDSGVVFMSNNIDTSVTIAVLQDMGSDGDETKGDNIFSATVSVNTDTTGTLEFSIRARDAVGNDTTILSKIVLDNAPPKVAYTLEPEPKGADSIHGEVYVSKIMMKGLVSDIGSGIDVVRITVRNDSGDHINNSPMEVKPENGVFSRIINLVPGNNTITLLAIDKAGNLDSLQGGITYILPKVSEIVTPDGGSVQSPNRSSVLVPKDALFGAEEISMRVVDQDEEPKPVDDDIQLLGIPHEFGPDGIIFRKPVTITLAYNDLDLDPDQDGDPDFKPEDLAIYFWDGSNWLVVGNAQVNDSNKTVSVEVNHFTLFDIGLKKSSAEATPSEFAAYWTHNPVKQDEGSTFVIDLPSKTTVSLSIYDMAGDLVRTLIPEQSFDAGSYGHIMWRGDNVTGAFAGAGLYIYVLKKGSTIIRKPVGLLKE